jgi:hypothetical protein
MARSWGPSKVGKLLTGTSDWNISLDGEQFILREHDKSLRESVLLLAHMGDTALDPEQGVLADA